MDHPNLYGEEELRKVLVDKIFLEVGLSPEDKEIFILRFAHNWYYNEIGVFVGNKYRNKPYSEGTIRHRISRIKSKIRKFVKKLE